MLEAKSTIKIGEPFVIKCRLTNTSERSMDLHLLLNTVTKLGCGYTGTTEFMVSSDNDDVTHSDANNALFSKYEKKANNF